MSEPSTHPEPSAPQILEMAIDLVDALLALLRSHRTALQRGGATETPTEELRPHPEDGVWNDEDIPF